MDSGSQSEIILESKNSQVLKEIVESLGFNLNLVLIQNDEQILLEKLKSLIGEKLIIEE